MFKEFLIVVVLLDGIAIRYCTCCLLASVWPNLGKFLQLLPNYYVIFRVILKNINCKVITAFDSFGENLG